MTIEPQQDGVFSQWVGTLAIAAVIITLAPLGLIYAMLSCRAVWVFAWGAVFGALWVIILK